MFAGHYTTQEVADKLGINPKSVTRTMKQHGVKGRKLGVGWLYPQTAVEKLAVSYKPAGRGRPRRE